MGIVLEALLRGDEVSTSTGLLYVVATPIGNLEDVTQRALRILAEVDVVAAEDTRHTRRLLTHYGIRAKLFACHDHNEAQATHRLLQRLQAGENVALVSDAGTPLVSDPGFALVRAARESGIRVVPVPGASAALCALAAAGLPTDRFLFVGFPPRSDAKRRAWIADIAREPGTVVVYESGNRVAATLDALRRELGGARRAVLARELTKRFETFLDGSLDELARWVVDDTRQQQGELVILVAGDCGGDPDAVVSEEARVLRILADALPLKQAAELTARITGGKKNRLYRLALGWRDPGT